MLGDATAERRPTVANGQRPGGQRRGHTRRLGERDRREPPPPTPAVSDAPLAILVIGAQRHPGEVGGFTFGRLSDSAPWLPATALDTVQVRAGTELRVELDERATIKDWTARIATAADVTADAVAGLASGVGPAAVFTAPGSGDWVVSVTITYGQGLGSGAYYWHLIVE